MNDLEQEEYFSTFLFNIICDKLGKKFKGYDWDKNYGYGTKKHLKAIKNLGITFLSCCEPNRLNKRTTNLQVPQVQKFLSTNVELPRSD